MPDRPPRQNKEEIEHTIDEENEVDEASLESFPASDAPAWTGANTRTVNPAKERADAEDDADAESEEEDT